MVQGKTFFCYRKLPHEDIKFNHLAIHISLAMSKLTTQNHTLPSYILGIIHTWKICSWTKLIYLQKEPIEFSAKYTNLNVPQFFFMNNMYFDFSSKWYYFRSYILIVPVFEHHQHIVMIQSSHSFYHRLYIYTYKLFIGLC